MMCGRARAGSDFATELRSGFGKETYQVWLTVGRHYTVCAIEIRRGWVRYYLADDMYDDLLYPVAYHAAGFEVVDAKASRYWHVGFGTLSERCADVLITFDEWHRDPMFYERLIDGRESEQRLFSQVKRMMDAETFSVPRSSARQ